MGKYISRGLHVTLVVAAIAGIVSVALAATPTLAAKGGRHAAAQLTSAITLNESDPHLGGTVTFTTNVAKLAGSEWPMVGVACSQSGTLVYGQLDTPDASFLLGGNSSLWLQSGGSADCVATLYAYSFSGGETIRTLASTSFGAAGS
jgi:hypothetical protein